MRVRVPAKCHIKPSANVMVAFDAGDHTTKRAWGEQLVAEAKGVEIKPPARRARRGEAQD